MHARSSSALVVESAVCWGTDSVVQWPSVEQLPMLSPSRHDFRIAKSPSPRRTWIGVWGGDPGTWW